MSGFDTREPTCQELAEFLTDYLEGVLTPAERASFDRHIAACRDCTLYVEQMRTTILVTGRLRTGDIPARGRDELLAVFRGWVAEAGR